MQSKIGQLYPSTKFFFLLLIILICMFWPGYLVQYAMLPVVFTLSLLSGTSHRFFKLFMKSIFLIVLFIFLIQVFIIRNEDSEVLWGIFTFSKTGLQESLGITSKIVGISSAIIFFFQVTSTQDINYALERSGVPKKVTFVVASTIQLIPQMSALSQTITDAQRSRGIETEGSLWTRIKSFVPMIGPLVLSSIEQTEEKVLALESRGFSSTKSKTSIYEHDKTKADHVLQWLAVLLIVMLIGWRVFK